MPLPTITGGWIYAYQFVLSGVQFAEVTGALNSDETDPLVVAAQLFTAWGDNWQNRQCASVELRAVSVTPLDGVSAATVLPESEFGTAGGNAVPNQVCQVVTLRTGLAGRSNRGRQYWPGLQESTVSGSGFTWDSADLANNQTAAAGWRSAMRGADMNPAVLSRTLSSLRECTSVQAQPKLGTQRRRLSGGI
jgi:hypothetical protein